MYTSILIVVSAVAAVCEISAFSPRINIINRPIANPNGYIILRMSEDDSSDNDEQQSVEQEPIQQQQQQSNRYDVSKLVNDPDAEGGGGFNQFDPVLSATGFLSRRFGIVGGLTVFAGLFLVEGREILKGFQDAEAEQGSGETRTTPSGLKITELLVGKGGNSPLPGYVIGLKVVVSIGDKIIYQTKDGEKPVAFKYGQRPFQNVICEGVEEGIRGMKVGGKRVLQIPDGLGPPGVEIPPGQVLTYEAELTEVLQGYF